MLMLYDLDAIEMLCFIMLVFENLHEEHLSKEQSLGHHFIATQSSYIYKGEGWCLHLVATQYCI